MPAEFFDEVVFAAEAGAGLEPGTIQETASFIAMDLADGVEPETFFAEVGTASSTGTSTGPRRFCTTTRCGRPRSPTWSRSGPPRRCSPG